MNDFENYSHLDQNWIGRDFSPPTYKHQRHSSPSSDCFVPAFIITRSDGTSWPDNYQKYHHLSVIEVTNLITAMEHRGRVLSVLTIT